MFKDNYKKAHNKIVPDKELFQKVIATADYELEKKNKSKTKISFYPYLYAAAAVLLFVTSLSAYNALKPQNITNNTSFVQKENDKIVVSENINAEKEEKVEKEIVKNDVEEKNKVPVNNDKKITEDTLEKTKEKQKPVTVLFNINHMETDNSIHSRSLPIIASQNEEEIINHSIYEEMSKEDYESYVGFSLTETVIVPQDMVLYPKDDFSIEKNSETGEIINDENTYYFENSFERFIMIATTKKSDEIDSFLNNESYKKSVINDKNIVITLADGIYNAYLKRNDVGIKITAGKIEEKELENTIKSLLE